MGLLYISRFHLIGDMFVIFTIYAYLTKNIMLKIAIIFITVFNPLMTQSVFGQGPENNALFVDLIVDLKALPEAVSYKDVKVFLDNERIETEGIDADGAVNIPVSVGKHTIKVWAPGYGADKISFEAKFNATGTLATTLTPHLIGLAKHIDDYKLSWVHGVGYDFVPTSVPMELNFVDTSGDIIPVQHLMDARLSRQYSPTDAISVTHLFKIIEPGVITLHDKDSFLSLVTSFGPEGIRPSLMIRARDGVRGLDYQAEAFVRLAPVKIDGQLLLGTTVPDNITPGGVKVSVRGVHTETDSEGRFSISGIPAGEVSISASIYDRQTLDSGRKRKYIYRARDQFDLSGPAKVELTLELKNGSQSGVISLIDHAPVPLIKPAITGLLSDNLGMDIRQHVRFKMINLVSLSSILPDWDIREKAEKYCRELFERNWRIHGGYCPNQIEKYLSEPIDVHSGPADGAAPLGQLHIIKGDVWFVSQDNQFTAQVTPEYHLSDWGYGGFGYAVTMLDYENGRAAIHLPAGEKVGWVDMASVLGKAAQRGDFNADDELYKSHHIGFSHLSSCGWSYRGQLVFLENTDVASFTYREPTPHDLWNPYDSDSEQPPLGERETITLDWSEAYSTERKLLLKPNPGKEC